MAEREQCEDADGGPSAATDMPISSEKEGCGRKAGPDAPARVGIFFGSTSYATADAARLILAAFGLEAADLYDIKHARAGDVEGYKYLVFGTSTWREGGLQHDWDSFIHELDDIDLAGCEAAVFALGDQVVWSRSFVDRMRIVYDKLRERGAKMVGAWPQEGYAFDASRALDGERFVGLPLDKMNQRELTPERVKAWVTQLRTEFGLDRRAASRRERGRSTTGRVGPAEVRE